MATGNSLKSPARSLSVGKEANCVGLTHPIAPPVVGEEEEELFLEDWSADRGAEFVLMLDRTNRREESRARLGR